MTEASASVCLLLATALARKYVRQAIRNANISLRSEYYVETSLNCFNSLLVLEGNV